MHLPEQAQNQTRSTLVSGSPAVQMLVELHGGAVPSSFEALEALPGVGHKTASIIMSHCFGCAPVLAAVGRHAWGRRCV